MQPSAIIKAWQQKLIDAATAEGLPNPLPKYGADGLGGAESQAAVIDYQKRHNLPVTGQLDDATRAALDPQPAKPLSSIEVAVISAALSAFLPPQLKGLAMFPTIVQLLISILPGVPDDIKLVQAELAELASTDSGIKKLRTALVFARALCDEADKILNTVDPQGAVQPNPTQVAIKPAA